MFRPFLPCGIAYGSAYALPMALPMAFHALFPAEGIPPGCLYCTISARCLSTGFGRISAAFAFFRRRGGAPVSGDCSGVAGAAGVGGALRGAYSLCCLLTLPLVFDFAPYPPSPRSQSALPRRGRGRLKVYFAGGFAPGTPALNRVRHLQLLPYRYPAARCKNGGNAFLWTMPAAKERGDRGRWNYPSQATAAFEMVLSPGAGIASAAWGQAPQPPRRVPQRQGQPATSRASRPITPAPHIPPAGRRQCGQNPAGRRDSRRTPARPRRRKWRAEQYREHG